MVWNSLWPDGSKSVKQNTTPGQQNTAYTENTLNNDHYWNIGTDEDGHHKSVQMKNFINSASGAPADAPIATGMDACIYLRTVSGDDPRIQGFFRNANGIYQFIPCFLTGSANITSSYTNIVALPNNTYGQIWMFKTDSSANFAYGTFKVTSSVCQAFCDGQFLGNSSTLTRPLRFGNSDQASGLNFRARTSDADTGSYQYRILYWGS